MSRERPCARRRRRSWGVLLCLSGALQGCALYGELLQRGGSLPLAEGGAEWRPFVTTPTGGAIGVQIIHRF